MARLVPHAETTAANLARLLRLHRLTKDGVEAHQRAVAARRLLEELGVRCDETAALHDLKGFLLSSPRGTEIVVCRDLTDEERLEVYAHLDAHPANAQRTSCARKSWPTSWHAPSWPVGSKRRPS